MTTQARPGDAAVADDAPVVSSAEIDIAAPVETVWKVLTAIDRWPSWNPDVKSVAIDGPAVEGTPFHWKAGPSTISSTVTHVERPRLIAWTGRTLGIRAIHVWTFEEAGGSTFVRTEESYEGLVARVLRRPLQKTLDKALADVVRHLKAVAEDEAALESVR
jgi:uncharacterized protein YndB with AHSA1/START domain